MLTLRPGFQWGKMAADDRPAHPASPQAPSTETRCVGAWPRCRPHPHGGHVCPTVCSLDEGGKQGEMEI